MTWKRTKIPEFPIHEFTWRSAPVIRASKFESSIYAQQPLKLF